jgi:hypothetical protein
MNISTYQRFPKIFALGHPCTKTIFDGPVEITEKVDGSQFSFGKVNGELIGRTKRNRLDLDNPDNLFRPAVEHIKAIAHLLVDDIFYFGETLMRPKHNILKYDRVPKNHIALFAGYSVITDRWMDYDTLEADARDWGVDVVPLLYHGTAITPQNVMAELHRHLDKESFLGGTKVEGVVLKNYDHDFMIGDQYIPIQCAKFVSEKFKEKHDSTAYGKKKNKQNWQSFCESYRTEARWQKAIQHKREEGKLLGEPKDIGPLIKEIQMDIIGEELGTIKAALWKFFQRDLLSTAIKGFPEWYKEQLAKGEIDVN